MRRSLKATTAIVASLNLVLPTPIAAQTAQGDNPALDQGVGQQIMEVCADLDVASCVEATGLPEQLVADALNGGGASGEATTEEPLAETPENLEAEAETATESVSEADEPVADAVSEPSESGEEAIERATEEATPPPAEVSEGGEETMEAAGEELEDSLTQTETGDPQQSDAAQGDQSDAAPSDGMEPTAEERAGSTETQPRASAAGDAAGTDEATTEPMADGQPDGAGLQGGTEMGEDSPSSGMTAEEVQRELEAGSEAQSGETTEDAGAEAAVPAEDNASTESATSPENSATETGASGTSGDTATTDGSDSTETDTDATAADNPPAEAATDGATDQGSTTAEPMMNGEGGSQAETDAAPETQMTESERAAIEGGTDTAVAATAEDGTPSSEVARETVTEESARSSGEDFDTAISREPASGADAQTSEETSAESDDDSGLSNLQKALLVGAGALAVGTLLNNNRQVVASSDDRVVVSGSDGGYELLKDDTALLQRPGTEVATQSFDDGSTRTIVTRPDGSQIVTIRDADLRVLQRVRVTPDGERIVLIDDTGETQPVDVASLRPADRPSAEGGMDSDALRQALATQGAFDRTFSLAQIRNIAEVREQVPAVELDNITFATGSAAIPPEQAEELTALGRYIRDAIAENPREIFLVEGHTDAVGNAAYNLALSDRRAESVALALTEYFDVPPENLVVQGYGERFLRVETEAAERANRRATLRRITPLLQMAAAN
ncbi:OmpA family protein [Palleronia sp. LCG004]|uniref:OmpA family protein n=1 Tax=Palleronia sp. LCG004 TaxID=3079304 RepID=UPI002943F7CD|nr:OmpA family protein [Palleronia sp. LCG004]WOI57315.1 OmpA family protein [Palleronia sp. LCG004]